MILFIIPAAFVLAFVIILHLWLGNNRLEKRNKQLEDWVSHDRKKRMAEATQVLKEIFH